MIQKKGKFECCKNWIIVKNYSRRLNRNVTYLVFFIDFSGYLNWKSTIILGRQTVEMLSIFEINFWETREVFKNDRNKLGKKDV